MQRRMDEGLKDEIVDFLKSKGIMKTMWHGRQIGSGGMANMSQNTFEPTYGFKDEDMLRMMKILHKRFGDDVFQHAGYNEYADDVSYTKNEFTFLDAAIANNNPKSLEWLISNVKGVWIADRDTFKKNKAKEFLKSTWFKKNGVRLIDYLVKYDRSEPGFYNPNYLLLDIGIQIKGSGWNAFNDHIEGLTTTNNKNVVQMLLNYAKWTSFVVDDDVTFVEWILKHDSIEWDNYHILRKTPQTGEIKDFLIANDELREVAIDKADELNLELADWLDEDARDIFIF